MSVHGRRRTKHPRKFEGPLAEPVRLKVYHSTLAGRSPEEARQLNDQERTRAFREWVPKFNLLFAHYGLDKTNHDWVALVVHMAVDFVPGFRVVSAEKRGPGRPGLSELDDICLVVDAELVKRSLRSDGSAVSDAKAVAVLTTEPPYDSRWGRLSIPSLQNKLSRARRSKNQQVKLWQLPGEIGQLAREGLIEMYGATRQNIFVSGSKR